MSNDPIAIGPYRIVRSLAEGGMAETFLAVRHGLPGFEKRCCIKRILPSKEQKAEFRSQFLAETRLASQLEHPNIVQAFDSGQENGAFYLVMEYIDGVDLRTLLGHCESRGQLLSIPIAALITAKLASALHHAHTFERDGVPQEIVHRDVTPSNVRIDFHAHVKLLDFGIALSKLRERVTATNAARGTVCYMSPEHLDPSLGLDARSDLFSLGSLFYHMLTGKNPFDSAYTDAATLMNIREGRYRPVAEGRPEIPPAISCLVRELLAVDKSKRPANGQIVHDWLAPYFSHVLPSAESALRQLVLDATRPTETKPPVEPPDQVVVNVALGRPPIDLDAHQVPPRTGPASVSGSSGVASSPTASRAADANAPVPAMDVAASPARGGGKSVARMGLLGGLAAAFVLALSLLVVLVFYRPVSGAKPNSSPSLPSSTQTPVEANRSASTLAPRLLSAKPEAPPVAGTAVTLGSSAAEGEHDPAANAEAERGPAVIHEEPTSAARFATLVVTVYDWGHIWVDGKYRGPSPARITDLAPGHHTVWLAPEADSRPEQRHSLTLGPGLTRKTYRLNTLSPKTNP